MDRSERSHNIEQNYIHCTMSNVDKMNESPIAFEDGPEYRSVSIQPLTPSNMNRLFSPSDQIKKSSIDYNRYYDNVEKERISLTLSISRWKVRHIQHLPNDYNLVRTNACVKDSNPQIVADRIFEALKTLPVAVDFCCSEDEVRFVDIVTYRIFLLLILHHTDQAVQFTEFPLRRNSEWNQAHDFPI